MMPILLGMQSFACLLLTSGPQRTSRLKTCLAMFILLLVSACDVVAPERCPSDMTYIDGGLFELGEWAECEELAYENNSQCESGGLVRLHPVSIGAFCVQTFPFPGIEGGEWPSAGPTYTEMERLDAVLPRLERRLCDMSELLLARAGPENWRYVYDSDIWSDSTCDPDDHSPEVMGSYPGCESPFGIRDAGVRSTWGVYDESIRQVLEPLGGPAYLPGSSDAPDFVRDAHDYALVGGVVRTDTFYAASNFGAHRHASSESGFSDDGLRICAEPFVVSDVDDREYTEALEAFQHLGQRYAQWLATLEDPS